MIELKPCPFCGGDAVIHKLTATQPFAAMCKRETCQCGDEHPWFNTEREAVDAWNARPESEAERLLKKWGKELLKDKSGYYVPMPKSQRDVEALARKLAGGGE